MCTNDMFHYTFKAEFVTLVSLKVPSGSERQRSEREIHSRILNRLLEDADGLEHRFLLYARSQSSLS